MSKHTPTPWRLKPNGLAFNLWSDDRMNSFCLLVGYKSQLEGEHAANAEFTVQAVNSHNELVAALKAIVEWEASERSGVYVAENPTAEEADQYMKVIGRAVAAITLAEEDSP